MYIMYARSNKHRVLTRDTGKVAFNNAFQTLVVTKHCQAKNAETLDKRQRSRFSRITLSGGQKLRGSSGARVA
jgi:hypothetical protein